MGGTGPERLGRGGHALLVALVSPGRSHARGNDQKVRAPRRVGQGPNPGGLQRAGNHAVHADVERLTHAPLDQIGRRLAIADLDQIGVGQTGHHGHAQEFCP
jgi:hypothetical protein